MKRSTWLMAVLVMLVVALPAEVAAQHGNMEVSAAKALQWTDLEVPGFDPGMKLAAIHGDPAAADQPYTLRLQFPDGYRFPAHWHPNAENLTVLSGTFLLAPGAEETDQFTEYAPGDFLHIPGRNPHSGGAKGVTVIQLHGTGPFTINLGAPPSN